ncbi:MAG: hypothetical protein QM779_14070 [Propionicimonas sp.]|uniref:hypothetical protein n=1 Tax=Propionicimonas sp. TaxID=1955623 RepID=UPI003D1273CC
MRILIVGTAGRDFHVFNTLYRDNPDHTVVAFTSTDLGPDQQGHYPACLSGPLYPDGLPILPESDLERIIAAESVAQVVFAYSEIDSEVVTRLAARTLAAGADFHLANPRRAMLRSSRPVIAVTSARSGTGKSPTVSYLAALLHSWGRRVAVVHHPVRALTFTDHEQDLARLDDTIVDAGAAPLSEPFAAIPGVRVFSGLDFGSVLAAAQEDADVVLWDGADSDLPFVEPTLHVVVTDPQRVDEESDYLPGEVGLRMADVVIITGGDTATAEQRAGVERIVRRLNPGADLLTADTPVVVEGGGGVSGRTVVVVEEEVALTLAGLRPGAGTVAAHQLGVSGIISPLPQAVGGLVEVYARHPEAQSILPAFGRDPRLLADLAATLSATPSEAVIDATRTGLASVLDLDRPVARAAFTLRPHAPERLADLVREAIGRPPAAV